MNVGLNRSYGSMTTSLIVIRQAHYYMEQEMLDILDDETTDTVDLLLQKIHILSKSIRRFLLSGYEWL